MLYQYASILLFVLCYEQGLSHTTAVPSPRCAEENCVTDRSSGRERQHSKARTMLWAPWSGASLFCRWVLLPHCPLILVICILGCTFFYSPNHSYTCSRSHCLCTFSHGFVVTLGCSFPCTVTVICVHSHSDSFPPLIIRLCSCSLLDIKSTCSAPLGRTQALLRAWAVPGVWL